jgi:hypothetical protein
VNEPRFEVYPTQVELLEDDLETPREGYPRTEFYWRFRAANGQITAVGGEGYTRREDAHRAVLDHVHHVFLVASLEFSRQEDTEVLATILDVDE